MLQNWFVVEILQTSLTKILRRIALPWLRRSLLGSHQEIFPRSIRRWKFHAITIFHEEINELKIIETINAK